MIYDEAREAVEEIRRCADDDSKAHELEDDLRHKFIVYVASLDGTLSTLAKIVLETDEIKFGRWIE